MFTGKSQGSAASSDPILIVISIYGNLQNYVWGLTSDRTQNQNNVPFCCCDGAINYSCLLKFRWTLFIKRQFFSEEKRRRTKSVTFIYKITICNPKTEIWEFEFMNNLNYIVPMFTACALNGPQWPSSIKACLLCLLWTLWRTSKHCQELPHVCAKKQTNIGRALNFKICIK